MITAFGAQWRPSLSLTSARMGSASGNQRPHCSEISQVRTVCARRGKTGGTAGAGKPEAKEQPPMDEPPISRGFRSRRQEQGLTNRIPPGQYVTTDFPVLSAGPTPQIRLEEWTFGLHLDGMQLGKWTWAEFQALPQTTIKTDIHCVTKWSKLDTVWQGVTFDDLLAAAAVKAPPAPYVMAHSDGGYTTNVPVVDLVDGKGMIATRYNG